MVEQALDLPHKFRKVDPDEVGEEAEQAVGGAYYAGEKHGEEHHRLRPLVQQVEHRGTRRITRKAPLGLLNLIVFA